MDRVFLTGAGGFVGSHVLRELLDAGYRVRALVRDSAHIPAEVETVHGDLRQPGKFARSLDGCRYVVHCAALYSFAPRDRALVREVNVAGTAGIVEAARIAGVERVILTSSSATVGPAEDGRPRNEDDYAQSDRHSLYHQSKIEQERAAFAGRVPIVALLPTAPVGPGDWKPTPTGRLVLDFARGKVFAKPPRGGGLNLVPVEDVARAHVNALLCGTPGQRYLLGAENLSFDQLWPLLAEVSGQREPRTRIPLSVALAAAYVDEWRCRLTRAEPKVSLEGVRMSTELMFADSTKAKTELKFAPGSVREALARAVTWYRAHDYLS